MKVLLLSTYDKKGGAAIAAYRLHQGLVDHGVEARMLVQSKVTGDYTVAAPASKLQKGLARLRPLVDKLPYSILRQPHLPYKSLQWLPERIAAEVAAFNPDLINLHWVVDGFLRIETLKQFNKPIVWTFHDMWALTGGCHYSGKCDRYIRSCGSCPQLNSSSEWDLSRWVWQRKAQAWKNLNLTIVTPSKWLADCTKQSSLFKNYPIEVIPNGIDTDIYRPTNKQLARKILGLPQDKQIILFGAISATSDHRKGFHLLLPALQQLTQLIHQNQIELVIFGSSKPENAPNFGFSTRYLGRLYDDISLALVYSAADLFLCPSLEDNLPNTIIEALASGTPCVAFKIGGIPELIKHEYNGYLAKAFFADSFAQGIAWILANKERLQLLTLQAYQTVQNNFTRQNNSLKYIRLFQKKLLTYNNSI